MLFVLAVALGWYGLCVWRVPFHGPRTGLVVDAQTGAPIPNAVVQVSWYRYDRPFGPSAEEQTASDGKFVSVSAKTDTQGLFTLERPARRNGFFGADMYVWIVASGYIDTVFVETGHPGPLEDKTATDPLRDTYWHRRMPVRVVVKLRPAEPVLEAALQRGSPELRARALELLHPDR
jgi:hypothetical protein